MKQNIKKVLKVLMNVIIAMIIIISAIVTIVSLNTKEKGVADIKGFIPFSIQSNSMSGTIEKGDLIIAKRYKNQALKKDQIISFFAVEQETTIIKTHRIVEIKKEGNVTSYVTKGDNNKYNDDTEVAPGDIVAVYNDVRLSKVGSVLDFFKSKFGFLLFIILPIFIFFIYQLYSFVTIVMDIKKEKMLEEFKKMRDEQEKTEKENQEKAE